MSIQISQTDISQKSHQAWAWWNSLEDQWKMAFNEAIFGNGPVLTRPKDEELIILYTDTKILRLVGPQGINPNLSFPLTNLSGLEGLKQLTFIVVTYCKIDDLKSLRKHNQLNNLFVNNNDLTSLKGIENLTQLQELYANVNQLQNLQPLKRLTNLKTLYVNYNNLTTVDGITEQHANKLRNFYVEPNENIPHKELIKLQMNFGIFCKRS